MCTVNVKPVNMKLLSENALNKVTGGVGNAYLVYGFTCPFCGKDHCFDMNWFALGADGEDLFACNEVSRVSMYPDSDWVNVYSWKRDEIRGATCVLRGVVKDGKFYKQPME